MIPHPLLEIIDLASHRGDRILFEGLCLRIHLGEAIQISGPNGSGKTTLLRIVCGLLAPTAGTIRWQGSPIAFGDADLRSDIGHLGHAKGVKVDLTPKENLAFAIALSERPTGTPIDEALDRLGMGAFGDTPVRRLSAGQRQRVALARLLVCKARLWVLDEPFTALDVQGIEAIGSMITDHGKEGGAVLMSSHQPISLEGIPLRTVFIEKGGSTTLSSLDAIEPWASNVETVRR
ncbi:cytochrome c biogenesis heme-transporting ATPase CcmA [Thioalkalivibrio sp. HK1]|uniref:cytochrome c biogenesis heme-transporting ATPase CcmA n=1 Tax=Thioalkalivibrio sp. HK1 TaxID=1469245 RepID=UPI0004ACCE2A|nr:cytochrome c biogenesis heme-transporting ATPase CcmA [Thioalkalivibrio sp. HK1]